MLILESTHWLAWLTHLYGWSCYALTSMLLLSFVICVHDNGWGLLENPWIIDSPTNLSKCLASLTNWKGYFSYLSGWPCFLYLSTWSHVQCVTLTVSVLVAAFDVGVNVVFYPKLFEVGSSKLDIVSSSNWTPKDYVSLGLTNEIYALPATTRMKTNHKISKTRCSFDGLVVSVSNSQD